MFARFLVRFFVRLPASAGVLLLALVSLSAGPPVLAGASNNSAGAVADSSWKADYAATELVRLTNGERAIHGLPALSVDELLTDKSRDGTVACPGHPNLIMAGRAKDMVLNDVFAHELRLCPTYTVLDDFAAWGYNTYRGENIAWNNYPLAIAPYAYGCSLAGVDCSTTKTTSSNGSVVAAMTGFMRSSEHRAIILGDYDRVGCGAWLDPVSDKKMYACLFSKGGPEHRDLRAPTISKRTGAGRVIKSSTLFSANFGDNWRLSAGTVRLDGKPLAAWFFDRNVTAYRGAVTVDPAGLSVGSHTLTWQATDAANRRSSSANAAVSFTVARP